MQKLLSTHFNNILIRLLHTLLSFFNVQVSNARDESSVPIIKHLCAISRFFVHFISFLRWFEQLSFFFNATFANALAKMQYCNIATPWLISTDVRLSGNFNSENTIHKMMKLDANHTHHNEIFYTNFHINLPIWRELLLFEDAKNCIPLSLVGFLSSSIKLQKQWVLFVGHLNWQSSHWVNEGDIVGNFWYL